MFGKRLKQARLAAGLSLRALAEKMGEITHTAIDKYEKDKAKPSSDILLKLAKHLGVRTEYFFRPEIVPELEEISYRKHSKLLKKDLNSIHQKVMELIERRIELENLFPPAGAYQFKKPCGLPEKILHIEDIEHIAEIMRQEWKLGIDPILDLVDTFELHGIRVFSIDIPENIKFDGLYSEILGKPTIVISSNWPGDRQRFTLAHELGHILLDGKIDETKEEKGCNYFAGAFLFPKESVFSVLSSKRKSIELKELQILKGEVGMSMMGILIRSKDLDIINEYYFKQMMKLFSKKGWRSNEPGEDYPRETVNLFEQLIFRALAEDCITEPKAAELLSLPLTKFRRIRAMEGKDASTSM